VVLVDKTNLLATVEEQLHLALEMLVDLEQPTEVAEVVEVMVVEVVHQEE
jgi:hypothetical protein